MTVADGIPDHDKRQNYLSGIAKRKPAFAELEPVLREAVAAGSVEVLESTQRARRRDVLRLRDIIDATRTRLGAAT